MLKRAKQRCKNDNNSGDNHTNTNNNDNKNTNPITETAPIENDRVIKTATKIIRMKVVAIIVGTKVIPVNQALITIAQI